LKTIAHRFWKCAEGAGYFITSALTGGAVQIAGQGNAVAPTGTLASYYLEIVTIQQYKVSIRSI
jgi:hypothetical protein